MQVEKIYDNVRYRLSNENLQVDDKVYPVARGRCVENDEWVLHEIDFDEDISGFPYEPHTIENRHYSDCKPYEVHTDHGYGPMETYFKIIKRERLIETKGKLFDTFNWVEMDPNEPIVKPYFKNEKNIDV